MSFDEGLAQRIREQLVDHGGVAERKMFGGLCFMCRGHMLVGVREDSLMARVGKADYEAHLALPHARGMDFTGRVLKGFVYVGADGLAEDEDLDTWLARCLAFNETLPAE